MAVNAGDKDIGGLGDGLQTGFQLWQVLYVCLNPGDDFLDSFPIAGLFVKKKKNLLS